jgi:hypothetical protein
MSSTGLFFLRGRPGAPFAVVAPGGGTGTSAEGRIDDALRFWEGAIPNAGS